MTPVALAWVVAPSIVAFVLLLGARPRRAGEGKALPLALALAYVVGHFGLSGVDWAPTDVTQWMPHLAAVGLVWALLAPRGRWLVAIVASAVAAWIVLRPLAARLSAWELSGALVLAAAALVTLSQVLRFALAGQRPASAAFAVTLAGSVIAAACAASGTLVVGEFGGMVAAACGGLGVAALLSRRAMRFETVAPVLATLLWGVIALTFVYAEMRGPVLGILSLVPLAPALPKAARLRRRLPLQLVGTALLGAVALWRALVPLTPSVAPATSSDEASDIDYGYQ